MTAFDASNYRLYLAELLAELELNIHSFDFCLDRLQRHREHMLSIREALLSTVTRLPHKQVLTRERYERSQSDYIKSSLLFSDHVVFDDPLLHKLDDIETFLHREFIVIDMKRAQEERLRQLHEIIDQVWCLLPLIESGNVSLMSLRLPDPILNEAINQTCIEYFNKHVTAENLNYSMGYVDLEVPCMGYKATCDVSKFLMSEIGLSAPNAAIGTKKLFAHHLLTTIQGLQVAERTGGVFFTSEDFHWNLAKFVAGDLRKNAAVYSFIHDTTLPDLAKLSIDDLQALLANDEALHQFRRELLLADHLIRNLEPGPRQDQEYRRVFDDVFLPNLNHIDSELRKRNVLKDIPWFLSSLGLGFLAGVASGGSALAASLSTSAALLGASGLFRSIGDPEDRVRREPAYILWKMRKMGMKS